MIVVNELSFDRDAANDYAASAAMEQLTETLLATKPVRGEDPIRVHTTLMTRRLTATRQVLNWAYGHLGGNRELRIAFLQLATAGPFVDDELKQRCPTHHCTHAGGDVSFSAVAWAAVWGGTAAGAQHSVDYPNRTIDLTLDVDGAVTPKILNNIWHRDHVHDFRRKYVPSPKHDARRGWGTPMDLDAAAAQEVLDRGVSEGGRVYGKRGDRYYVFHSDNIAGYHGYPVDLANVPPDARRRLL